jgi:hypothetical protein
VIQIRTVSRRRSLIFRIRIRGDRQGQAADADFLLFVPACSSGTAAWPVARMRKWRIPACGKPAASQRREFFPGGTAPAYRNLRLSKRQA